MSAFHLPVCISSIRTGIKSGLADSATRSPLATPLIKIRFASTIETENYQSIVDWKEKENGTYISSISFFFFFKPKLSVRSKWPTHFSIFRRDFIDSTRWIIKMTQARYIQTRARVLCSILNSPSPPLLSSALVRCEFYNFSRRYSHRWEDWRRWIRYRYFYAFMHRR